MFKVCKFLIGQSTWEGNWLNDPHNNPVKGRLLPDINKMATGIGRKFTALKIFMHNKPDEGTRRNNS